jgi:hypothetical protein
MPEFAPQPDHREMNVASDESLRINNSELAHLGALVVEAALRKDLTDVAQQHVEQTGKQHTNTHTRGLFVGRGEIPMSGDNIYRSVNEKGVVDLAQSGVVRGQYTATEGLRSNTNGHHATFWSDGNPNTQHGIGQGFVIEASKADADAGWVTADKIQALYGRDSDGQVKNILPQK